MHVLSRLCVKPTDDGGVLLGSCDYTFVWGEGNSIRDPKTSKFLSMQTGHLKYEEFGQAAHVMKNKIELYNETHRVCLLPKGLNTLNPTVVFNGHTTLSCSETTKFNQFKLLPGMLEAESFSIIFQYM